MQLVPASTELILEAPESSRRSRRNPKGVEIAVLLFVTE